MIITTKNGKPYMSSCGKVMPLKHTGFESRTMYPSELQQERIRELINRHKRSLDILEKHERTSS